MDMNQNQAPMAPGPRGKNTTIIVVIIVVILVILFVVWKVMSSAPATTSSAPVATDNSQDAGIAGTSTEVAIPAPKTVTVTLTDSGYSPSSITINAGDTVTFVNNSKSRMWTASGPHPSHTDYPGFDEKSAAANGESYSFTFTRVGTWSYHNHLNSSQNGTVIVKALPVSKG